jgi:hypothetical protein
MDSIFVWFIHLLSVPSVDAMGLTKLCCHVENYSRSRHAPGPRPTVSATWSTTIWFEAMKVCDYCESSFLRQAWHHCYYSTRIVFSLETRIFIKNSCGKIVWCDNRPTTTTTTPAIAIRSGDKLDCFKSQQIGHPLEIRCENYWMWQGTTTDTKTIPLTLRDIIHRLYFAGLST